MLKIENDEVFGWEHAIRGMRNPKNSWDLSDSVWDREIMSGTEYFKVGDKDYNLMKVLANAGTDHGKFLRMITVYVDITCNHTWWAEFDTYKVGTVRNSCSKMHKIHAKEFTIDDFSHEGIDELDGNTKEMFENYIAHLEELRKLFNETKDKKYWRALIEMLPMGFNIKATVMLNYAVLKNMYHARKNHKLKEWHTFCEWIEGLPHSELITDDIQTNS